MIGFLFCADASAQKKNDTLIYYLSKESKIVTDNNDAYFTIQVSPPDNSFGDVLYHINIYNKNHVRVSFGDSKTNLPNNLENVGAIVSYYQVNGAKKGILHSIKGINYDLTDYYPNGHFFYFKEFKSWNEKFIECRDSTGKILATNGEGKWIEMNGRGKIVAYGNIKDSLQVGSWHGILEDGTKYEVTYTKGQPGKGIRYDSLGKAHKFKYFEISASFNGGGTFSDFLKRNIKIPAQNRKSGIGGRVIISFTVNKDGVPGNYKIVSSPDNELSQEAIRVISLSTWNPGYQYGIPVPNYFTVPLDFAILKTTIF